MHRISYSCCYYGVLACQLSHIRDHVYITLTVYFLLYPKFVYGNSHIQNIEMHMIHNHIKLEGDLISHLNLKRYVFLKSLYMGLRIIQIST